MAWVKADMHLHAKEDVTNTFIKYSAKELIDLAAVNGFKVLSFTFHDQLYYDEKIIDYAAKKGILLIPGTEATIQGKHVLIYNANREELRNMKNFNDLRSMKRQRKDILVVAPHPFTPLKTSMNGSYQKYSDVFDALECVHLYTKLFDVNRKAWMVSRREGKPFVANSDLHFKQLFGSHYTLIKIEGDITANKVLNSIKKGNIRIQTTPLKPLKALKAVSMNLINKEF